MVDYEYDEPLHEAIRNNDEELVRKLLESGHNPNVKDYSALVPLSSVANSSGSIALAEMLLEKGADPDGVRCCLPPLVMAAIHNRSDLVRILLKKRANPNILDEDDQTALMWTLIKKNQNLAMELLESGADPSPRDRDNLSARDYAERSGCEEVVKRIDELLKSNQQPE